jgi:hypothetical protein
MTKFSQVTGSVSCREVADFSGTISNIILSSEMMLRKDYNRKGSVGK